MDIVLGVSMTPTTVRMVLVEGENADGPIVDHDVFDVTAAEGSATSSSAADQVVEAVLGTKESAAAGGHHLKSIGVTWSDHAEASTLRDTLAARGINDVMLVSDGHAAGALAQAVGRAVGYATTALLFIDRDTATLSVVQTDDGSVVKVLSRSLHSGDAMAVLADMAAAVDAQDSPPQGMFVVGSGVDVTAVKAHLETLVSLPVSAPDEAELALARGAALASANAPAFEATTVGLAYSQDPDGTTAGNAYIGLAAAATQLAPVGAEPLDEYSAQTDMEPIATDEGRKPFLLVGSALTSIFVVGVVALVISLAVSIRPTVDQRPSPRPNAIVPSTVAPEPAPVQQAQQPVAPPPPAETIKPPMPVAVQEAPAPQQAPRQVFVEQAPAPQAAPPPPAAPPPAPEAPPVAPAPIAPAPVPYIPAPVYNPPVYNPPVYNPPVYNPYLPPPAYYPPRPRQWTPPWQPPQQEPPQQDPPDAPQYPQYPSQGGSGGGYPGSGSGSYPGGSGGRGDYGSGHSGGGRGPNCFLIFCSG
ncbi:hypothetical protein Mycsm_00324 [Mycobacterium sp. JS623]|uniref:DUF7159 family protein n=1 Tax=Mycobacterium sp. JS623 TaxID=212767 RepID=UPI0002A59F57|nr:hypothetical protein [Mycobacterium sp. JS623]AGB20777.1 hypothetical protein Mycsm_00324 [Mycobacterium sp. JS623]